MDISSFKKNSLYMLSDVIDVFQNSTDHFAKMVLVAKFSNRRCNITSIKGAHLVKFRDIQKSGKDLEFVFGLHDKLTAHYNFDKILGSAEVLDITMLEYGIQLNHYNKDLLYLLFTLDDFKIYTSNTEKYWLYYKYKSEYMSCFLWSTQRFKKTYPYCAPTQIYSLINGNNYTYFSNVSCSELWMHFISKFIAVKD